jgi:SRSO17 transposase
VAFKKKWEIALDQLDAARSWGVRSHVVLADAAYGDVTELREALAARKMRYAVAVQSTLVVWPPGVTPLPPLPRQPGKRGRPPTRHRDGDAMPVAVGKLAEQAGRSSYRKVTWREGTRGPQSSRFMALRVRTAHRHSEGIAPGPEEWLLCEWGEHDEKPRCYLSNLPADCSLKKLVRAVRLRWRVERDYQDMKDELGLDHFEGRRWRGFHHHVALCAAAHAFLALRRALFPPEPREVDAPAREAASATPVVAQARRLPLVRQRAGASEST